MNYLKTLETKAKHKRTSAIRYTAHHMCTGYCTLTDSIGKRTNFTEQVWQHCDLRVCSSYSHLSLYVCVPLNVCCCSFHRLLFMHYRWYMALQLSVPYTSARSWSLHLCMWVDSSRRTGKKLSLYLYIIY